MTPDEQIKAIAEQCDVKLQDSVEFYSDGHKFLRNPTCIERRIIILDAIREATQPLQKELEEATASVNEMKEWCKAQRHLYDLAISNQENWMRKWDKSQAERDQLKQQLAEAVKEIPCAKSQNLGWSVDWDLLVAIANSVNLNAENNSSLEEVEETILALQKLGFCKISTAISAAMRTALDDYIAFHKKPTMSRKSNYQRRGLSKAQTDDSK